jgi:hypothetical protein
MNDIFRKLNFMQKMRIEVMDDAVDEIIRIRAHNEKMIAHSVDLERMLSFGAANNDDLLAVVRAMREEDKP